MAVAERLRRPGWLLVARKEFADHLLSVRFGLLVAIVVLLAAGAVYAAAGAIRDVAAEASGAPSLLLRVLTVAPERLPPFYTLVGFLAPLLGIAFGFDSVNGERAQGTLPRLLSQPIHRDDVINGKAVAGLTVVALVLVSLTALVCGVALLRLGVRPALEDWLRILLWLGVAIVYVAFWLSFATLCSVWLRRAATSALMAIAVWLVATLFIGLLSGLLADVLAPAPADGGLEQTLANARLEQQLARLSPNTLYEEATVALLTPETRAFGFVLPQQVDRAIPTPLSLGQSLLVIWPQVVALVALTVASFAGAYVLFMRQEVRA